jgi:hypothetical protein
MAKSSKAQRLRQVDFANANMRVSGFEPDDEMLELQRRFVHGEITAHDLLDWVAAYVRQLQRLGGRNVVAPKDAH